MNARITRSMTVAVLLLSATTAFAAGREDVDRAQGRRAGTDAVAAARASGTDPVDVAPVSDVQEAHVAGMMREMRILRWFKCRRQFGDFFPGLIEGTGTKPVCPIR